MAIHLYNTLTRQKERFVPLEEGKVKMYLCGPTVYNYIHIGNARPAVVFDTVRRYLQYRGYDVTFVSNFTDVDDKIIRAANERGEDIYTLSKRFIRAYFQDIEALGVKRADIHPKATETISEIIHFISELIEKGYAYEAEGDVYFRTRKFPGYGKLSHQSIDELRAGARIEVDEKKEDPLDFALWKAAKPGEASWDSPWGKGRPGWHIECSAMVKKHLGETIDMHVGGQDLIFPHHENEIAQTEALTEQKMANYWLHNGYIKVDNEKMSKSLGNFILVHELIQKYDPKIVRFFLLTVHYRHPINFTEELLQSAARGFERIRQTYLRLKERIVPSADLGQSGSWPEKLSEIKKSFIKEMDDDFNTANAITVLFELTKEANVYLKEKNTSRSVLKQFSRLFSEFAGVLGLELEEKREVLDQEIEKLIEKREAARKRRDFAEADAIRDKLKEQGIVLEDTPHGVRWRKERP